MSHRIEEARNQIEAKLTHAKKCLEATRDREEVAFFEGERSAYETVLQILDTLA